MTRTSVDLEDLPRLARGCSVLGAGGGGDTWIPLLAARQAIEEFGPVPIVDLDDLPDAALVMPCGCTGAPAVGIEKIGAREEPRILREAVEAAVGTAVAAIVPSEIGGGNGLTPIGWAARLGLPVADADGMGRAFPRITQTSMELAGVAPVGVMCDEHGNQVELRPAHSEWLERAGRSVAEEFGARACSCEYPLTVREARTACLRGTVTMALELGAALLDADDPFAELERNQGARRLIVGKVVDLEQRTAGGFTVGALEIDGVGDDAGRRLRVEYQNENLVAREGDRLLAMVPDIISVLDTESGEALHTEKLRFGQRATVVALPAPALWRSDAGLALGGPRSFGYDVDFVALEELARA